MLCFPLLMHGCHHLRQGGGIQKLMKLQISSSLTTSHADWGWQESSNIWRTLYHLLQIWDVWCLVLIMVVSSSAINWKFIFSPGDIFPWLSPQTRKTQCWLTMFSSHNKITGQESRPGQGKPYVRGGNNCGKGCFWHAGSPRFNRYLQSGSWWWKRPQPN